jgi:murein tripeptide amidase MpaA
MDIVGTYASYDEMIEFLQDKANTDPNYIKVLDLGPTFQGRSLKAVSLQFNPSSTRNIWIDCGIHARGKEMTNYIFPSSYSFFVLFRMDYTSYMYLDS